MCIRWILDRDESSLSQITLEIFLCGGRGAINRASTPHKS